MKAHYEETNEKGYYVIQVYSVQDPGHLMNGLQRAAGTKLIQKQAICMIWF